MIPIYIQNTFAVIDGRHGAFSSPWSGRMHWLSLRSSLEWGTDTAPYLQWLLSERVTAPPPPPLCLSGRRRRSHRLPADIHNARWHITRRFYWRWPRRSVIHGRCPDRSLIDVARRPLLIDGVFIDDLLRVYADTTKLQALSLSLCMTPSYYRHPRLTRRKNTAGGPSTICGATVQDKTKHS